MVDVLFTLRFYVKVVLVIRLITFLVVAVL
jgi:hypothetical protein